MTRRIQIETIIRTAVVAVLLFVFVSVTESRKVLAASENLKDNIIRFHIRANSDSEADQELKLMVKDKVVEYIKPLLAESENVAQSKEIIEANMEDILKVASDAILEETGERKYEVKGYITKKEFPIKVYGDVALPAGEYTAFCIDIGAAKGRNWWCVLYPPLCFVDVTYGVVSDEDKEMFSKIVGDEEFCLTNNCSLEFKYLTFLNRYIEKNQVAE